MSDDVNEEVDGPDQPPTRPVADDGIPSWSGTWVGSPVDEEPPTMPIPRPQPDPVGAVAPPAGARPAPAAEPRQPLGPTGPTGPTVDVGRRRWRPLLVLLGAAALVAMAGAAGWLLRGGVSTPTEVGGEQATTADADPRVGDDDTSGGTDPAAPGAGSDSATGTGAEGDDPGAGATAPDGEETTGSTVAVATTMSGPFVVPDSPDNPSGATQYAVMAGGKAVMRGWYPTAELAAGAVADAAVIMGGLENVVDETQVDPRAEIRPDSFAVYLQDFILFESNSAEITPEFHEFLGFPLFFMQSNPAAAVTVVARTDARGSESYNLDLATRRAEAVRDYWLANGGDADQIILDPRGEEEADEDADAEQAALDRRVELQVSGFLAG
jgi:outer membrane protein OmpA-like peptidoglycan-associated protein